MIRRYPAVFVLVFVLLGIVLSELLQIPAWFHFVLLLAAGICGLALFSRKQTIGALFSFALALGAMAGMQYGLATYDVPNHHIARILHKPELYQIFGQVVDWPDIRQDRTDIQVALDSIRGTDRTIRATGSVLLKISDTTTALQQGDRLEFVARLYPLHQTEERERFSYRRYLQLRGIAAMAYMPTTLDIRVSRRSPYGLVSLADKLRSAIVNVLRADLSEQASALALGFLMGETRDIPKELYDRFRDSGTLHLLAVSGSNVGLLAGALLLLLRPFLLKRVTRGVVLLLGLVLFAFMSYLEPSVVRACVMASLVIVAGMLNRRYNLNQIIALTALIVLLAKPTQLFEIGFQLSFVTAWGLIAFVPPVLNQFKSAQAKWWFQWLIIPVIVSFVAQICSAPIVAYYFEQISLLSIPANLIVVPLVALSVLGVVAVLLAHLLIPTLGQIVGGLLSPFMDLVVAAVQFFGEASAPKITLPSHIPTGIGITFILLTYCICTLLLLGIGQRNLRKWAVLSGFVTVNGLLVYGIVSAQATRPPQLIAANIPGGVMTIVTDPSFHSADIILTGIRARTYPIDSVIFGEMLKKEGVTRISRLVVMAADYDALDDLLRLAVDFRADSVYMRAGLRAATQEVLTAQGLDSLRPRISWYSRCRGKLSQDGLLLDEQFVQYRLRGMLTTIVAQGSIIPVSVEGGSVTDYLVVGNLWYAQPDDWIRLHEAGFSGLVCARLAQRSLDPDPLGPDEFDRVPPEYVHDLTARGLFRRELVKR